MGYPKAKVIIAIIQQLDIEDNIKTEAINYVDAEASNIIVEEIPSLANCGFNWASSPQGLDFWLKINSKYTNFLCNNRDVTLESLMTVNYIGPQQSPNIIETTFDRMLYVIRKLPISRADQRKARKELLRLKRKNIIHRDRIVPTSEYSGSKRHLIDEMFNWSSSKLGHSFWNKLDDEFNDYTRSNPSVLTEPIPVYSNRLIESVTSPIPISSVYTQEELDIF